MARQLALNPPRNATHFKREIATGATELFARMANFIAFSATSHPVANIFGMPSPAGTVAIDNQHVRGTLAIFFAKTRMGWKETVPDRHKEPVGGPIENQDTKDARQRNLDMIDEIAQRLKAGKTGEPSED